MSEQLAADVLLLLHLGFVLFVVLGGLLVVKWLWLAWLHLPCVLWGALIEFGGWLCPLTPLEQRFRAAAGEGGYSGSFIEHYVTPLIYPAGLTRGTQIMLGLMVVIINIAVYRWVFIRRSADRRGVAE